MKKIIMVLIRWLSFALLPMLAWAGSDIAFFYGKPVPVEMLQAYDRVVVEPANLPSPPLSTNTQWLAYVSLGEVTSDRTYASKIPTAWKLGQNAAWGGWIIDQRPQAWPNFVLEHMITPLWQAGYRGFFLDTLDAFMAVSKTATEQQAQAEGLARVITAIKTKYPSAHLIANRGFEIMPRTVQWFDAMAFESLYQGWDANSKKYREVSTADRQWLLAQVKSIQEKIPVIAIDYVEPKNRGLARTTARRIREAGLIPWVADAQLETLGLGNLEAQPRIVLVLYDGKSNSSILGNNKLYISTPLNQLGLVPRYIDIRTQPTLGLQTGQIAGVISWLDENNLSEVWQDWLSKQIGAGVPWVALGQFGFVPNTTWQEILSLNFNRAQKENSPFRIRKQDAMFGYEAPISGQAEGFMPISVRDGNSLLTIESSQGTQFDAAAITPWGGYVLSPYLLRSLPDYTSRWLINPTPFLARALHLPNMPMPDVTTENGRRILVSHIDGDGFVSQAEFAGYPYAGEVLLKEVLQKTPLPVTMSVIEGEVGPAGQYPAQSAKLEAIARQIYALPNIELASHSYTHPFRWGAAIAAEGEGDYHLNVPGYQFDLKREISGSVDYINQRLAPSNKKTKVFLWTGDCNPPEEALRMSREAGLLSMNAGDTWITRSMPTLTVIAPIGLIKGQETQIFAPNQNENVYTNNWQGPFYGYQRVIETFEMTDKPIRWKPINIYYHAYAASKRASLIALNRVYDWAMQQPITPMFASDYIQRAQGFFKATIAQSGSRYEIRNGGALRTLRMPLEMGYPDLSQSRNVAGFYDEGSVRYIHLTAGDATLVLQSTLPVTPYLAYSNALLSDWKNGAMLRFKTSGWLPLRLGLGQAQGCQLLANGKSVPGKRTGNITNYELTGHAETTFQLVCTH